MRASLCVTVQVMDAHVRDPFIRNWLDLLCFLLSGLPANGTIAAEVAYMCVRVVPRMLPLRAVMCAQKRAEPCVRVVPRLAQCVRESTRSPAAAAGSAARGQAPTHTCT